MTDEKCVEDKAEVERLADSAVEFEASSGDAKEEDADVVFDEFPARSGFGVAQDAKRGVVWVLGGVDNDGYCKELLCHEVDDEADRWESVRVGGEKPPPNGYGSLCLVGDLLVHFGGILNGFNFRNDMRVLDLAADRETWAWRKMHPRDDSEDVSDDTDSSDEEEKVAQEQPNVEAVCDADAAVVADAPCDEDAAHSQSGSVAVDEPPSEAAPAEVPSRDDIPAERCSAACVAYGDGMLVFGGLGHKWSFFDDVWHVDLCAARDGVVSYTKVHTKCPEFAHPASRGAIAVCHDGFMYLFGGRTKSGSRVPFDVIHRLHLSTCTWSEVRCSGDLPDASTGSSIVVSTIETGDVMIMYGGSTSDGGQTNLFVAGLPKLQAGEMAWHCHPEVSHSEPRCLAGMFQQGDGVHARFFAFGGETPSGDFVPGREDVCPGKSPLLLFVEQSDGSESSPAKRARM